jgi:hypothetical protein
MFNLKTKLLQRVSRFKLHPVKYESAIKDLSLYSFDGSEEKECSAYIGLVGLKPLTVAFPAAIAKNGIQRLIVKRGTQSLSTIDLKKTEYPLKEFSFYTIGSSRNFILKDLSKAGSRLGIAIKNRLQPNQNFTMQPKHIKELFDLCVYPRPVYILSGIKPGDTTCFPLDVVGLYPNDQVLFSIRSSNAANPDIQARKRILLSRVPYDKLSSVYSFGKNNYDKKKTEPVTYETFGDLSYPSFAFGSMEITIESFITIGSHYCYSGRINKIHSSLGGEQLAHAPWFALNFFSRQA